MQLNIENFDEIEHSNLTCDIFYHIMLFICRDVFSSIHIYLIFMDYQLSFTLTDQPIVSQCNPLLLPVGLKSLQNPTGIEAAI